MTLAHPIYEILGKQNNQSSYFFTENLSLLRNLPNFALIPRCSQVSGHPVELFVWSWWRGFSWVKRFIRRGEVNPGSLYVNCRSSNQMNDTTLVSCDPSSAGEIADRRGVYVYNFSSYLFTRLNFTSCYCDWSGSAFFFDALSGPSTCSSLTFSCCLGDTVIGCPESSAPPISGYDRGSDNLLIPVCVVYEPMLIAIGMVLIPLKEYLLWLLQDHFTWNSVKRGHDFWNAWNTIW
jgi:hypothetical protein